MLQRRTIIANPTGLHARPAALFAQKAATAGSTITIARDGEAPIDAASILSVMSLGLAHGDTVMLEADESAAAVLDALVELLETNLDAVPA
ncbi:HPr family phosphocarrier protein [Demequina mangrovi]|uniref:Phosphocarrier protein HPr n=1 Tax=Demequina mangrovi TaxID=1043493 RepID=A0A1H6UIC6_9MICO|nr:HPr family phosphocarrier protein [Demequina mangrovi]SEI87930.1 Phosphocarrier protein HPr [Demequina mangrovi]